MITARDAEAYSAADKAQNILSIYTLQMSFLRFCKRYVADYLFSLSISWRRSRFDALRLAIPSHQVNTE